MNEAAEQAEVVNGIKMEKGRVYLRDKRNGTVYQYEDTLSRMGFIEQFIYGEEPEQVHMGEVAVAHTLDGPARAAAWDAQASKNLKANTVTEVSPALPDAEKKEYRKTDKAEGFDLKVDFLDKGWTKEQLLAEGYIEEVPGQ